MDVVPERIFEEILISVLDECFPESHWATKESFVRRLESKGCVDHFINRTCKVYNISVVTCYFLERILIPSPCNNFGCLSSQVSCGRAYPRTAKPWRLSSQFEQNRISWLDVFTIFCYNTVIPLNKLTCLGQQNINLRIRNESSLIGKKHTTLYKYVIIFGAACIFLRRQIFIFKDLTNVIFGIGSTKTSESPFRALRVCCAAWLFLAPLFHKKRKWSRQTNMRARLSEHIFILLFWRECLRIDANGAHRRSKQYNKRDW